MASATHPEAEKNLAPRAAHYAALMGGNAALALGPWLVRLADTGPVSAGFWRMLLPLPLFALLALRERTGNVARRGTILLLLAAGAFFAADLASWHIGIERTKLGNSTLFGNSGSIVLMVWGLLALRRAPRGREWLALAAAFGELGIPLPDGGLPRTLLGPPLYRSLPQLVGTDLAPQVLTAYRRIYGEAGIRECLPFDGIDALLHDLAGDGVTLAVATSKAQVYAEKIVEFRGWTELFATVCGDTLDAARPTKAAALSSSVTSSGRARSASIRSTRRAPPATRTPASRSFRTVAAPMPLEAPVTIAVLPSSSMA